MGLLAFAQYVAYRIVKFLASTTVGQLFIKFIDRIFYFLVDVAKYSVAMDKKEKTKKIHNQAGWIGFGLVLMVSLLSVHLLHVALSTILVKLNKKPIESEDIAKTLKKWRRSLRSFRLVELPRSPGDQEIEVEAENEESSKSTIYFRLFFLLFTEIVQTFVWSS